MDTAPPPPQLPHPLRAWLQDPPIGPVIEAPLPHPLRAWQPLHLAKQAPKPAMVWAIGSQTRKQVRTDCDTLY